MGRRCMSAAEMVGMESGAVFRLSGWDFGAHGQKGKRVAAAIRREHGKARGFRRRAFRYPAR